MNHPLDSARGGRSLLLSWMTVLVALAVVALTPAPARAESVVYGAGEYFSSSDITIGPSQIWLAKADGTNPYAVLVQNQTEIANPVLSPDGSSVAFARNCYQCGISLINVDGTDEHVVLPAGASNEYWTDPSFSPDGRSLLATRREHYVDHDEASIWRVNTDGSGLTQLISWADSTGPHQGEGVYSPDGTKIAFNSSTSPSGTADARGSTLWVANSDGTNPQQVTMAPAEWPYSATAGEYGSNPAWSRDGTRIAYARVIFEGASQTWSQHIAVIPASGGSERLLTNDPTKSEAMPSWSSDDRIAFARYSNTGTNGHADIVSMAADGSGESVLLHDPSLGLTMPSFGATRRLSNGDLLERYKPFLKYDAQETYRADSPAELTDSYFNNGVKKSRYSNYLRTGKGKILAAADPTLRYDDLTLGYLGFSYPGGQLSATSDYIDVANSYVTDFQRLHSMPKYADKTYGRVVHSPDGTIHLQYWFFYYDNPKQYPPEFGIGAHEGDWEMAQVDLNASQDPVGASYSQHKGGEQCNWNDVSHPSDLNTHPIVYVAEGSHANYFKTGFYPNELGNVNGDGTGLFPTVVDITDNASPDNNWLNWRGHWGGSADSPAGPLEQGGDKWVDPARWSSSLGACTVVNAYRVPRLHEQRLPARPPTPKITARRARSTMRVKYAFQRLRTGQAQPYRLIVSVQASGKNVVPYTRRWRLAGRRSGTIRQPLGVGHGPYKVLVSAESQRGARGETVSVAVQ